MWDGYLEWLQILSRRASIGSEITNCWISFSEKKEGKCSIQSTNFHDRHKITLKFGSKILYGKKVSSQRVLIVKTRKICPFFEHPIEGTAISLRFETRTRCKIMFLITIKTVINLGLKVCCASGPRYKQPVDHLFEMKQYKIEIGRILHTRVLLFVKGNVVGNKATYLAR